MLPRGTKTWQSGDGESIIDLILALEELATSIVKCVIHATEHSSDHRAIETTFDVATPERAVKRRLLSKKSYGRKYEPGLTPPFALPRLGDVSWRGYVQ